jgi:hypothetical protein
MSQKAAADAARWTWKVYAGERYMRDTLASSELSLSLCIYIRMLADADVC